MKYGEQPEYATEKNWLNLDRLGLGLRLQLRLAHLLLGGNDCGMTLYRSDPFSYNLLGC